MTGNIKHVTKIMANEYEVSRALTRTGTRRAADKQRLEELPQE